MNAGRIRDRLTSVWSNLLQALEEHDALLADVAGTPLEAKAAALMPPAKRAAIVALAATYGAKADAITERINNVDTDL